MAAKRHIVPAHDLYIIRGPAISSWVGEVGPVIGQHGVNFIGDGQRQRAEKVPGNASGCLLNKLDESEFGSSVNGYKEIKPAFGRMHLSNIDVEIANRIALELLLRLFVASNIWQPRNTMALKASMQRRTCQKGDRRLERIKTIIERQNCMPAKRNNDCFLFQ